MDHKPYTNNKFGLDEYQLNQNIKQLNNPQLNYLNKQRLQSIKKFNDYWANLYPRQ